MQKYAEDQSNIFLFYYLYQPQVGFLFNTGFIANILSFDFNGNFIFIFFTLTIYVIPFRR